MPFLRIEFQDGTHKLPTQDYHGSGRPHVHMLGFGDRPEEWEMHKWASATLPPCEYPELQGYVRGSQFDHHGDTPWKVHKGESCWDSQKKKYRLQHSAHDHCGEEQLLRHSLAGFFAPDILMQGPMPQHIQDRWPDALSLQVLRLTS